MLEERLLFLDLDGPARVSLWGEGDKKNQRTEKPGHQGMCISNCYRSKKEKGGGKMRALMRPLRAISNLAGT